MAREGPGTSVDVDRLAAVIADFDVEESDEDMDDEAWSGDDDLLAAQEAAQVISLGLLPAQHLWRQRGAVDQHGRLTHLGWWGIPASLQRAWHR